MADDAVLDASALLALIHSEPGHERVISTLPGAKILTINLAEVVGKLAELGMPSVEIRTALGGLGLEFVPFDTDLAYRAGALRPVTRRAGLSLADRACISLAQRLGARAYTTDTAWSTLDLGIEVVQIR